MEPTTLKEEQAIIDSLQSVREQLKNYRTPIVGCDEQYSFLLSERDCLTEELSNIRQGGLRMGLKAK